MNVSTVTVIKVITGAHGKAPRFVYWLTFLGCWLGGALGGALAEHNVTWLAVSGVAVYLFLVIAACRARDMGSSGKFALLTLVPMLGLLIFFQLGFEKSASAQSFTDSVIPSTEDFHSPPATGLSWHMPVSFLLFLLGSIPVSIAFMTLLLGGIQDTNGAVLMTGIGVIGAVVWTTGVLIGRRGD